ncbi:MAG: VCBS repeat-containing protein [Planctomycetota bacterium]
MPWELTIVDADLPAAAPTESVNCFCAGDFDGDGHVETAVAGNGVFMWHRPATGERGMIRDTGFFGVGMIAHDIDGDGRPEIVTAHTGDSDSALAWYKPDGEGRWSRHVIDPDWHGILHDIRAADLDGDGVDELVGNRVHCAKPGLHIWKRGDDPKQPWTRTVVQEGKVEEGLVIADVDGDGQLEIVSGVRVYKRIGDGWTSAEYARGHREMCRVEAIDITGNGKPDLVAVDSEYLDGKLSWFELLHGVWIEHEIDRGLYYAHSLQVRKVGAGARLVVAEMKRGGWNPPFNHRAKIYEYTTNNAGKTWRCELTYEGAGTHEAELIDIDGDGEEELVGKEWHDPRVQVFKRVDALPFADWEHHFLDRDKPEAGIDMIVADVDGDGQDELLCGSWIYDIADGLRTQVPDICQIIAAHDFDGDGNLELIATLRSGDKTGYDGLTCELAVCKQVDGDWAVHPIGTGVGDWPHGAIAGPVGPGGKAALITSYHSAHAWGDGGKSHFPEIWFPPDDLIGGPWEKRTIAEVLYGEELLLHDLTGDGRPDVIAGAHWFENHGDGTFTPHKIVDDFYPARIAVGQLIAGRVSLIAGQEDMDYPAKKVPWSPIVMLTPGDDVRAPWQKQVIDTVRCAHSIGVADLDGDGKPEIIAGEHDPFAPYRSHCKLFVYKPANTNCTTWKRYELDHGYEHHDGCKPIRLPDGNIGIASHAWNEPNYVHLWRPPSR